MSFLFLEIYAPCFVIPRGLSTLNIIMFADYDCGPRQIYHETPLIKDYYNHKESFTL